MYFPFLDESPEFRRDVLDALRQPLESGSVQVARAHGAVRFPARFQLVLAANPCPCGLLVGKGERCRCSVVARRSYLARLSGPLMDRIDVQLQVRAVTKAALAGPPGEGSAAVATRVLEARERQRRRWHGRPWRLNAQAPGAVLRGIELRLPSEATKPLEIQLDRGQLTLRGYDRCLRLAWTLADLRGETRPGPPHVLEALGLRTAQAA
ncbi:ATP-binding protein [Metallococcus carri]|uniref:ATP-binding protein n=1 Tax=Metallococcus carri TaxID=1656884 RepID=UPI002E2BD3FD|nr:ATP-binding protein [Metallococcus carri]